MTEAERLKNLEVPSGQTDCVLDTDTYNEIDDQFALSLLVKHEKTNVKAIYACPFFNSNSSSPEDGMEKSYDEIMNLLTLMGEEEMKKNVYKGSREYLKDEKTYIDSPAARHLCELAMQYSKEKPLYVVSIGCITNVASAILMKPEIVDNIVVVWLGGHYTSWIDTNEFNMMQDISAARIVFGCGCRVIVLRIRPRARLLAQRQKSALRLSCKAYDGGGGGVREGQSVEQDHMGRHRRGVAYKRWRTLYAVRDNPCADTGVRPSVRLR